MGLHRMVKCSFVAALAGAPDHTPEIMMSLSQRLHVLADPIAALITELRAIAIQETADPGRISSAGGAGGKPILTVKYNTAKKYDKSH